MLKPFAFALGLLGLITAAHAREPDKAGDWTDYRNPRFGFSLSYPATLFVVERTSEAGDGRVFASRAGDARLLVGALPNRDGYSAKSYQDYIARTSYADFRIDYRRLGDTWFALSGEGNGKIFYEKVMFTCSNKLINSFAIIYPAERRALFDPVVERIENTFKPGRTSCAEPSDQRARQSRAVEPRRFAHRSQARERRGSHSALADRIARARGKDVIVVLRRTSPPYDYKVVHGYAAR
jgi:hypothetical protein